MIQDDPYNLRRFLSAQEEDYQLALEELRRGQKVSHWIWYIFPQLMGLGTSSMAQDYAVRSREEAVAYLTHPILGERLKECCEALLIHEGDSIEDIMGFPDDMKLKSSMTLFSSVAYEPVIFDRVLDVFYDGNRDKKTINFLASRRK